MLLVDSWLIRRYKVAQKLKQEAETQLLETLALIGEHAVTGYPEVPPSWIVEIKKSLEGPTKPTKTSESSRKLVLKIESLQQNWDLLANGKLSAVEQSAVHTRIKQLRNSLFKVRE